MASSSISSKVDVSSEVLSKLECATWKTLSSSVAASWRKELDEYIDQTKRRIHDRITSDSAAFHAQLDSARSTQERLRTMSHGVDSLNHAVFDPVVGLTPVLLEALRQHQTLAQASLNADVIHASLLYLEKCKTQLKYMRKLADTGDLPAAVSACTELHSLLEAVPRPLNEARVTTDIKNRLRIVENGVFEMLDNACSRSLVATAEQIVICPSVLVPGSSTPLPLSSILTALSPSALSTHLTTLRRDLTTYYFDRILQHSDSKLVSSDDNVSGRIIHTLQRRALPQLASPDTVLDILPSLLEFLDNKAFSHLPQPQRENFPRSLTKPLTTSIMTHLLKPSLPSKMDALPDFLVLTQKAVDFESKYIIGVLGGDCAGREIQAWSANICTHYERARRVCILDTFRDVMLASAACEGATFLAEISDNVSDRGNLITPQQQDTSKSAMDDASWGFDDEPEDQENSAAETSKITPGADAEVDPGDAWGWNDENLSEGAATQTGGDPQLTPSDEDGAWDDPWGDGVGANVPEYTPVRPESTKAAQPLAETSDQSQHVNDPTAEPHDSLEGIQDSNHVTETYTVSTLMIEVIQTVENCLQEGKSLAASHIFPRPLSSGSSPGDLIMHSGCLILDLHCALYPVAAASRLSLPVPHMQFSNDCYYLSQEAHRLLKQTEGTPDVMIKLQACADDLKVLADSWYYDGIEKRVASMNDILVNSNGFTGISDEDRYDECQIGIAEVLRDIKKVARNWKAILPKRKYYIAIGNIADSVLARMIDDILSIPDITEAESHKLSELCRMLLTLEPLFSDNTDESFVVFFVPSWLKFSYLYELLEASMVDLTYLFEKGALVDFEIDELAKLVRALFADTPLRTKTLEKILAGHPVRR